MIEDLFVSLNDTATTIGWAVMIGGALWLYAIYLKSSREEKETQADYENMVRFEGFLREERPDVFERYQGLKTEYTADRKATHWHEIAQQAGLTIIEILKDRR